MPYSSWPKVVVIGGGFGGIEAAKILANSRVQLTLIDKENHHLFQPLLYQVATAGLSPANIAWPIRSIFKRNKNVTVLMAEVSGIDAQSRKVIHSRGESEFDYIVIATGATNGWFGHDEWADHAVGLKSLDDAMRIRNDVLCQFEQAETAQTEAEQKRLLTFAVIGGGPTGVELAGSLAELAKRILADDFRSINPRDSRIVLIEAGDRLLSAFDEDLGRAARRNLEDLGVEVWLQHPVSKIENGQINAGKQSLEAGLVAWGAGVAGTPVGEWLGAEVDRGKRVIVDEFCRVPGHEHIYVIGDVANFKGEDGKPLPGVATVAIQQGTFVGRRITQIGEGELTEGPFEYHDPGSMATIGRKRAVVQRGDLKFTGFIAWLAWLFVHLIKIMSFRNKLLVFIQWIWAYFTYQRGVRLITKR